MVSQAPRLWKQLLQQLEAAPASIVDGQLEPGVVQGIFDTAGACAGLLMAVNLIVATLSYRREGNEMNWATFLVGQGKLSPSCAGQLAVDLLEGHHYNINISKQPLFLPKLLQSVKQSTA